MDDRVAFVEKVAIYLRKSRGDSEQDLEKHKNILTNLCDRNGWKKPVIYEEIGSGDSISVRPVFEGLLRDIEAGLYDAVCVVDTIG